MTPVDRFARWVRGREDRLRVCAYGFRLGETSEPRCQAEITLRESALAGHRGYCSHRHDALAQEDQPA
ncbi:MAG: hypothetical protein K0S37_3838 [Microbacterium sp.]|nr:hypothetical protein [Microbacterium sp.]